MFPNQCFRAAKSSVDPVAVRPLCQNKCVYLPLGPRFNVSQFHKKTECQYRRKIKYLNHSVFLMQQQDQMTVSM